MTTTSWYQALQWRLEGILRRAGVALGFQGFWLWMEPRKPRGLAPDQFSPAWPFPEGWHVAAHLESQSSKAGKTVHFWGPPQTLAGDAETLAPKLPSSPSERGDHRMQLTALTYSVPLHG